MLVLILLISLIKYDKIKLIHLLNSRKLVLILIFVISALITPPDIISQILIAGPLYTIYEIVILLLFCKITLMELIGLEPTTSCVQNTRSTS